MLNEPNLLPKFSGFFVRRDTSTYILNRILIRAILGKTPYEILRGYSQNSKAYIILNKHTRKIKESLNVTFDETPPPSKTSPLVDDDLDEEEAIREIEKKNLENAVEDETLEIDDIVNIKESRNHPLENKPKNVNEALGDESWIVAMQEELNQFIANDVWELVPQPRNMKIIGTKWVFRNKLDENGIVSRNKARLVAQGYNQQEGIDYDETYAPVARLESIRILFAYACALDFKLFQMDVKGAFLNDFINEDRFFKHVVFVSPELDFDRYLSHDRAMHPLTPHYERKTRADRGKKRPRDPNTSSSSPTLNHPSSSHPLVDPTDENDDESSHSNPSSPSQNISSSSNNVSRVYQNPHRERHYLNTYLFEAINSSKLKQKRMLNRGSVRSIGSSPSLEHDGWRKQK
ncbi:retrovirus-related pol polyprotein from transposon TNT 1-94 [Tanacetum coccineum]|uniref:Retrovirus-related pol polyprotein from transposon TNT 1-94 n=1 Tax=Tanacetum coccineum TaxID=301880 RepID=A0ABQ4ZFJ8_9ASTR